MNYKVRCGSKTLKIEIDKKADFSTEVPIEAGRKTRRVKIYEKGPNGDARSISIDNKILSVQVRRRSDGFPYKVMLNGTAYPVEIEKVESTRYKPPVAERKVGGKVYANLPGQIRKVMVSPGDEVRKGQPLLILEAMKMENEVAAPCDGIIEGISVAPNQLVTKGESLIDIGTK